MCVCVCVCVAVLSECTATQRTRFLGKLHLCFRSRNKQFGYLGGTVCGATPKIQQTDRHRNINWYISHVHSSSLHKHGCPLIYLSYLVGIWSKDYVAGARRSHLRRNYSEVLGIEWGVFTRLIQFHHGHVHPLSRKSKIPMNKLWSRTKTNEVYLCVIIAIYYRLFCFKKWCHQPKIYSIAFAMKPVSFCGVLGLVGTTYERGIYSILKWMRKLTSFCDCEAWYAAVSGRIAPRLLLATAGVSEVPSEDSVIVCKKPKIQILIFRNY